MSVEKKKRYSKKIKIKDTVKVITGKNKGMSGEVLEIKKDRILVKGVNIVKTFVKPNQANEKGKIVSSEAYIHYSNVALVN